MDTSIATTDRWGGGHSPYGQTWQKLMMWFFIVGDALLFAGFLSCYGFARLGSDNWPVALEHFSATYLTVMTFVLISSSLAMACAVSAAKNDDRAGLIRFLFLTLVGGVVFLGMQGFEWAQFISEGGRPWGNEFGDRNFGAYFFLITGFHGTHVLIGLIVLAITLLKSTAGKINPNGVEIAGLYWHFVDLVWVLVFGCFYLIQT